jgi:hypothetical protein
MVVPYPMNGSRMMSPPREQSLIEQGGSVKTIAANSMPMRRR